MRSHADKRFWRCYKSLPRDARSLARKTYRLWRSDPDHPTLRFKKIRGDLWSIRVGLAYRALATEEQGVLIWFWIGPHDEYERLLRA